VLEFLIRHRGIDLLIGASAGYMLGRVDDRWLATSPHRLTIYSAAFGAATTLLGIVLAALAIIKGIGDGPRITELRRRHGSTITSSMQGAIWALLALLVVSFGALVAESGDPGRLSLSLTYGALALGVVRLVRLAWVVGVILAVGDTDDQVAMIKRRRAPVIRRSQRTAG
jgi:hypothetical protein